jgi:hypothetical protein
MPELRNVRPEDAIRAFERAGGVSRQGNRSARQHQDAEWLPNGQILTFSATRDPIKIGLVRAMLRKAGISDEEFVRLLGR